MTKTIKRICILIIGIILLLIGILMLFLPGPAFLVIPAALAILASEFVWAQKILEKIKSKSAQTFRRFKNKTNP